MFRKLLCITGKTRLEKSVIEALINVTQCITDSSQFVKSVTDAVINQTNR